MNYETLVLAIVQYYGMSSKNANILARDVCMSHYMNPNKSEQIINVCSEKWNEPYIYNIKG